MVDALRDAESGAEDEFKPVDGGGPAEQFADDTWGKLLTLTVLSWDGKKSSPLFIETKQGTQTVRDDPFKQAFGKNDDIRIVPVNQAKLYHRAVGRFAAHCLCQRRSLPIHLMPKLLWNGKKPCPHASWYCCTRMQMSEQIQHTFFFLFLECTAALRDSKPTDPCYSSLDLGTDVLGVGVMLDVVEETKETHGPNDFRELIEETHIFSNTIWLDSFSRGLLGVRCKFLAGHLLPHFNAKNQFVLTVFTAACCPDKECDQDLECFPVKDTLSPFPLETVKTLLLSTRQYSANALLCCNRNELGQQLAWVAVQARFCYSDDCDENQEELFSFGLRDLLFKWEKADPEMLPQFVQFAAADPSFRQTQSQTSRSK